MKQLTRPTLLKLLIPVLYAALTAIYFFVVLQQTPVQSHHVIGIATATVAFVLWIIARVQLGNSFTIGAHAKELVTVGLYSKLRHPVYYFSILAVAGIAIFAWNIYMTIPIMILIVIEIIRIRQEEQVLTTAFGEDYLRYKQTTWF
jgi:protein-S-isoprenylcysteine O-methyltransferase Ste14